MMQNPQQPPTTYREQIALLHFPKGWLKLFGYMAIAYFLTPTVLGLLFLLMLFPLGLALARLSFIWTPAYHLAGRVMGVEGMPEQLARPPTWTLIYSIAWIAAMLVIVGLCARAVFVMGFCNQNLICMLRDLPKR